MCHSFVIEGKLPSLNEVIRENRSNRYAGAKLKKEIETLIGWAIKKAKLTPITNSCVIEVDWHEATKRRDVDNIHSSVKFILDALVKNGTLKNDSRRYVKQIYHKVIDDTANYVVVRIYDETSRKELNE
jgi:Holliday junction resolvase RusA-like endonuclease